MGDVINARPITHAEIEALAAEPRPVEVYLLTSTRAHGQTLTRGTLTVARRRRTEPEGERGRRRVSDIYYRPVPAGPNAAGEYRPDLDGGPVGFSVKGEVRNLFGTVQDVTLFSSVEAEASARLVHGHADPSAGRDMIFVADPHGEEWPLTPIFGSEVTVRNVIRGVEPDEAQRRVEEALRAEFGEAYGALGKVMTRAAADVRVNVVNGDGVLLATNILKAEVSLVTTSTVTVSEVDPDSPGPIVGR